MTDTIAAISTPMGEGGIGIVRVSGPDAIAVAGRVFRAGSGKPMESQASHTVRFGSVTDDGQAVDQALATVFRAPHSYTGEDTVEISAHGGPVPLRRTLALLLRAGAHLAGPGEFTQRAFVNGRLDLAQAEAVIDSIRAKSDAGLKVAIRQLEGVLSRRVNAAREALLTVCATVEASTDFPDEVPDPDRGRLAHDVGLVLDEVNRLLMTAESGRVYREGVSCAIIGRPNVGKSSILNAILRDARAIVTDVPGTTRDVLEESVTLGGVAIRLLDTAGLRETSETVERIGVERTRAAIAEAGVLMVVLDASTPLNREDEEALDAARGRPSVVVLNKSDLSAYLMTADVSVRLPHAEVVCASMATGAGLADIEMALAKVVLEGKMAPEDVTVSRARHVASLESARDALSAAMATLRGDWPLDLVAQDLQTAARHLGEIGGQTASERVIQEIFARFCVGK